MQRSNGRPGDFLVGLTQANQLRFQFSGETRALQALLVEKGFQVTSLYLRSSLLVAFLSVFTGLNELFEHDDCVIFVHNSLLGFGCTWSVGVWQHCALHYEELKSCSKINQESVLRDL